MGTTLLSRTPERTVAEGDYNPQAQIDPEHIVSGDEAQGEQTPKPSVDALRMKGPWLEQAPELVIKGVLKEIERQRPRRERRFTMWKAYKMWRQGKRYVRLVLTADRAEVYAPPSTSATPPNPNKCDTLIRRLVSTIMADPPVAECVPPSLDDQDRDAAELSERILLNFGQDEGMNLTAYMEDALDKAATFCSGFLYGTVTPHGSQVPKEVQANVKAVDGAADPRINPETGLPEPPYVRKFVTLDGQLEDTAENADFTWVPKVQVCVLTGHNVLLLPEFAEHAEMADGALVIKPLSLGELKARFESAEDPWGAELLSEIATFRPDKWEETLPAGMRADDIGDKSAWVNGVPNDETLCFPVLGYRRSTGAYPFGAYIAICGKKPEALLYRGPWGAVTTGQDGTGQWENFQLPLVQMRFLDDHINGDNLGTTLVAKLGPMDDIRASQIAATMEFAFRVNHPREYLPVGSIIQPEQIRHRDGRPVFYNSEAGLPITEQFPTFPPVVREIIDLMSAEMDSESGLEKSAQGAVDPSVRSDKQQQTLIEQSLMAVGGVKRNSDRAFVSLCRLILMFVRAYYTVPQRLRYVGVDGQYKEKSWSRSDLRGVTDVTIRKGSGTMMPKSAKTEVARAELDLAMKAGDPQAFARYQRVMSGNLDPLLGSLDDSTTQRVRGQLSAWQEGPPEEIEATVAQEQQEIEAMGPQPVQLDPATGAPIPPPQAGVQLQQWAQATIFDPLPADDDPQRALARYQEICRFLEGEGFRRWGRLPEWQGVLLQEFARAKASAGVMTVPEQQAAQAAMAQQQAEQGGPEGGDSGPPQESQ
jgi:hypothetical protein